MTTFLDGPAAAMPHALMLKRSPIFLRVTFKPKGGPLLAGLELPPGTPGDWDALDQPEDRPAADEILFAYRLEGKPGHCHIRATRGRGGFFPLANYRLVAEQPSQELMRDKAQWRAWCVQHAPPLGQY